MISEKQLAANRRNALLSTGPRSDESKKRVSLNGLRHGLTGQTTILSPEDRAAHDQFCAGIIECLNPENALELQVAHSIADDHRLQRVRPYRRNVLAMGKTRGRETNIFALGHLESPAPAADTSEEIHTALNSARVFLTDAKQFALLSIYEQRIHRNLQKSIAQLNDLQTAHKRYVPDAPAKAQPNSVNSLPGAPAENGFGFANDPIHPAIAAAPVRNPTPSLKIGIAQAT